MQESLDIDFSRVDDVYPERAALKGIKQLKWDVKHLFVDGGVGQLDDLLKVQAEFEADVILADPAVVGALFLQEKGGPPVANYGLMNLMMSSRDTAPFGPGLQ